MPRLMCVAPGLDSQLHQETQFTIVHNVAGIFNRQPTCNDADNGSL